MDIMSKVEAQLSELKTTKETLTRLKWALENAKDTESPDYIKIYEQEFDLSIRLLDEYEQIMASIRVLQFQEGMTFFVRRIEKEAKEQIRSEVMDVYL